MKCGECRWWGTEAVFVDDVERECLNPDLKARAVCEFGDAFGEKTSVATEPDFGCIQFEGKT